MLYTQHMHQTWRVDYYHTVVTGFKVKMADSCFEGALQLETVLMRK